jgi:hypothetical protein
MGDLFQELWGQEAEKTASHQAAPASEDEYIEKIAASMTDEDLAQAQTLLDDMEAEKQAGDYEVLGRFMARGFHDELSKLSAGEESMVGMAGSAQTGAKADGKTPTLMAGGDTSPNAKGPAAAGSQGQSHTTPQDGGKIVASLKAKLDALHQPASPTQAQDAQAILKKMVDAAKIQKTRQQVAEVPADI